MKVLKITLISLISLFIALIIFSRLVNFYPDEIQEEEIVCTKEPPKVKPKKKIKVFSWNVQYMAGKNYVFYYEFKGNKNLNKTKPDKRPSTEDINKTFTKVAEVIKKKDPDILLLQEVDDGASRTDKENQTERLLNLLPKNQYPCYAETFYWKSAFIPHPYIMGSVGMKLVTLSKYKITKATRYSLPLISTNWFFKQFNLKRAILEVILPYNNTSNKHFAVLNTHLSAFAKGTDHMKEQVKKSQQILDKLTSQDTPWIIGGDFNLLPDKLQYNELSKHNQKSYLPNTELALFFEKYQSVPSIQEATGPSREKWYTYIPNRNLPSKGPDRTIDYIFLSKDIRLDKHYVLQKGTLNISDHLPIVIFFNLPK